MKTIFIGSVLFVSSSLFCGGELSLESLALALLSAQDTLVKGKSKLVVVKSKRATVAKENIDAQRDLAYWQQQLTKVNKEARDAAMERDNHQRMVALRRSRPGR